MGLFGRAAFVLGLLLCVLMLAYLSGVWPSASMSVPKAPAPRVPVAQPVPVDIKERSSPCASDQQATPAVRATLCEVVRRPVDFVCRRVQFRATLLTDCMHGAVLVSQRCERGIVPGSRPSPAAVDAFFDDACSGTPFRFVTETKTATFTGQFRLHPREDRSAAYVLEIEDIENVTIARRTSRVPEDSRPQLPEPPVINVAPDIVPALPEVLRPHPEKPAPHGDYRPH